ncbi:MAG TPA: ribonuclease J [Dongiaceae bacterium]|nr:ribonuclease J [Dongiaceae bacterium]
MTDRPGSDELLFLPLGGCGEIGMNLNLYGHDGKWLMIDLGITFGNEMTPGIDVIMPDPGFIVEHRADLLGLVLTHAHEDHIGAVPYLWPRLRCPIYATAFTAAVLRRKLAEANLLAEARITEIPMSGRFGLGPFEIELISITHSIPEPNAVVLRTKLGNILHTGDWKLDPDPVVGPITDEAALRQLGGEGVLAMVCDSTNVLVDGSSGSEAEVRQSMDELIGRYRHRVAVACFASNVARIESVTRAGLAHGRHVGLVGRSLRRMVEAARETGYLTDLPDFVEEEDIGHLPRDRVLMICTGSQGEPRSALARIARDEHPDVGLEPGDAVIFSSRIIPGNEHAIGELHNALIRQGIEVVTEKDHFVHVSGHPARDELAEMYRWVKPAIAVPVHGELRHLRAHVALAESCQVRRAVLAENGSLLRLAPGDPEVIGHVPTGRLGLDGTQLTAMGGAALKSRQRMAYNGAAVATIVLDGTGRLVGEPVLTVHGVAAEGEDEGVAKAEAVAAARQALAGLPPAKRSDDQAVREVVRIAIRRSLNARHGKKPLTDVHLVRLPGVA